MRRAYCFVQNAQNTETKNKKKNKNNHGLYTMMAKPITIELHCPVIQFQSFENTTGYIHLEEGDEKGKMSDL